MHPRHHRDVTLSSLELLARAALVATLIACAPPEATDGSDGAGGGEPAETLTIAEHLAGAEGRELLEGAVLELEGLGCTEVVDFEDDTAVTPHPEHGYSGFLAYRGLCQDDRSAGVLLAFDEGGAIVLSAAAVGIVAEQSDGRSYYSDFHATLRRADGTREVHDRFHTLESALVIAFEDLFAKGSASSQSEGVATDRSNLDALGISESKGSASGDDDTDLDPSGCDCQECMSDEVTNDSTVVSRLCSAGKSGLRFAGYGVGAGLAASWPVSLAAAGARASCWAMELAPEHQQACYDRGCCPVPQCLTAEDCTPEKAVQVFEGVVDGPLDDGPSFLSGLYAKGKDGCKDVLKGGSKVECYRKGGECLRFQINDQFYCEVP